MEAAQVEIEKTATDTSAEIGRAVAETRRAEPGLFGSIHFAEWLLPLFVALVYSLVRRWTLSLVLINEEKRLALKAEGARPDVLLCDKMISPQQRERLKREWDEAKKTGSTIVLPAGIIPAGGEVRAKARGTLARLDVDEISIIGQDGLERVFPGEPGVDSLIVTRTKPDGGREKLSIKCDPVDATLKLEEIRKIMQGIPEPPPGPKPFFVQTREPLDGYGPGIMEKLYPLFMRGKLTREEALRALGLPDDDRIEPDEQDRTLGLGGKK